MFGRITPMVKSILMVNVVVFVASFVLPLGDFLGLYPLRSPDFKPFQLFSYMFVHADFGHILFNMIGLIIFGAFLESFWGQNKFLTFYMVTGIGAGLLYAIFNYFQLLGPVYNVPMVGASGAVYGLIMGCAILFPNTELFLLFPPMPVKMKWLALFSGGVALFSIINRDPSDNVAHMAHLGGMIIAFILLKIWQKQRKDFY